MKLYLVERLYEINYGEYDSFVVRAESKERALQFCQEESDEFAYNKNTFRAENTKITELLNEGKEEIILGSYNAG